jgi:hypothetical protein
VQETFVPSFLEFNPSFNLSEIWVADLKQDLTVVNARAV